MAIQSNLPLLRVLYGSMILATFSLGYVMFCLMHFVAPWYVSVITGLFFPTWLAIVLGKSWINNNR